MPGYSGTPLIKKLGIKENQILFFWNKPESYESETGPFPAGVSITPNPDRESCDFVHAFVHSQEELESCFRDCKPLMKMNAMFWISWPKKASGIATDLNENIIRDYILNNGLVDVKVISYDAIYSGLKLMYRLRDRK